MDSRYGACGEGERRKFWQAPRARARQGRLPKVYPSAAVIADSSSHSHSGLTSRFLVMVRLLLIPACPKRQLTACE